MLIFNIKLFAKNCVDKGNNIENVINNLKIKCKQDLRPPDLQLLPFYRTFDYIGVFRVYNFKP